MTDSVEHGSDDLRPGRPDTVIRSATNADVAAILAFGQAVVPAHYTPIIGAKAAATQLDWWTQSIVGDAVDRGRELVAVGPGGGLVGVCETGEFDGAYVIWKLYVRPDQRSSGVGAALLRTAIDARPADADEVWLEHFAGNVDAARFYDREGFVPVRVDPAETGDPAADVVWRRRSGLSGGPRRG